MRRCPIRSSLVPILVAITAASVAACGSAKSPGAARSPDTVATAGATAMNMTLTSPAFDPDAAIPRKYSCEGDDLSPPLAWSGAPANAQSLVLIVDDPDAPDPRAPKTTYVHWLLYDLPPGVGGLAEGASTNLPLGAREGVNDWKRTGWGGPCPPVGRHRYFFKLYALDRTLGDLGRPSKADLVKAMDGHVVAHGQLVGTYEKGH
jgi:Raf kinase inhibitor-like YbhB/YbcL family protein